MKTIELFFRRTKDGYTHYVSSTPSDSKGVYPTGALVKEICPQGLAFFGIPHLKPGQQIAIEFKPVSISEIETEISIKRTPFKLKKTKS